MQVNRTVRDFENALERLLNQQSFDQLTVDQICEEALLHHSSFYRYFHSKDDLLNQLISNRVDQLVAASSSQADLLELAIDYIDNHRQAFRHISSDNANRALFLQLVLLLSDDSRQKLKDQLATALGQDDKTAISEMLIYSLTGAFMGTCFWWQQDHFQLPKAAIVALAKQTMSALASGKEKLNDWGTANVGND